MAAPTPAAAAPTVPFPLSMQCVPATRIHKNVVMVKAAYQHVFPERGDLPAGASLPLQLDVQAHGVVVRQGLNVQLKCGQYAYYIINALPGHWSGMEITQWCVSA